MPKLLTREQSGSYVGHVAEPATHSGGGQAIVPAIICASAAVATAFTISRPNVGVVLLVGLLGLVLAVKRPALTLLMVLLICQELNPNRSETLSGSPLLTLGYQVYFVGFGSVAIISVLVIILTARTAFKSGRALRCPGQLPLLLLCAWALADGMLNTQRQGAFRDYLSVLNLDVRPFLFIAAGMAVGLSVTRFERRRLARWFVGALAFLAAIGLVALGTGQYLNGAASGRVVFYDSAMGAVAASALLACLVTSRGKKRWATIVLAGIIVVLAFRRNVFISLGAATLFVLTIVKTGREFFIRTVFVSIIFGVAGSFLFPNFARPIVASFVAATQTYQGQAREVSTGQHIEDIRVGWQYVKASPLMGYGPDALQLPGLSVQQDDSARLYVHNEFLLTWLRFGVVGLILLSAVVIAFVRSATRTLRAPGADPMQLVASCFMLIAPLTLASAPFLTTTSRWPLMLGFAAGLVSVPSKSQSAVSSRHVQLADA